MTGRRRVPFLSSEIFWEGETMLKRNTKKKLVGYFFLSPWLLGFFSLTLIPMCASLYFSFCDYDMLTPAKFIGFSNYVQMFSDRKFLQALQVTFVYVGLSVPFQLCFALLLACLFKQDRRGIKLYRSIYYLPSLLGGSVAVSILWRRLFVSDGMINKILGLIGISCSKNWIASVDTALGTLIILSVWQFGSSMVIFLASLKQIPTEYYEASAIDGAGRVRRFFRITLPLLTPMVFFNIVMTIINAFQAFTPAYIISGGDGSPMNATLFYTLYLYNKGFGELKMGYASALAWFLLIIISIVTALLFGTSRKWVYYD